MIPFDNNHTDTHKRSKRETLCKVVKTTMPETQEDKEENKTRTPVPASSTTQQNQQEEVDEAAASTCTAAVRRHTASKRRTQQKKQEKRDHADDDDGDDFYSDSSDEHNNTPGAVRVSGMHGPTEEEEEQSDPTFTSTTSSATTTTSSSTPGEPTTSTLLQAELAPDREDDIQAAYERGVQDQQEVLEQHTDDIRQRLKNLERERQEGIALAVAKNEQEEEEHEGNESSSCSTRKQIIYVVLLLAMVGGIVVGALYGSGTLGGSHSEASPPTSSPITTILPSASPTEFLLYDPPSQEDCLAIANNGDIEGQLSYDIVKIMDIRLNVTVDGGSYISSLLWDLKGRLQNSLAPALAGCQVERRRTLSSIRGTTRNLDAAKYVVANARIEALYQDGRPCNTTANDGATTTECYGVEARLYLVLKGDDETDRNLKSLVEDNFGGGDLVERLSLRTPFQKIELFSLTLIDLTTEPPNSAPA
jgi:hypothetical protein